MHLFLKSLEVPNQAYMSQNLWIPNLRSAASVPNRRETMDSILRKQGRYTQPNLFLPWSNDPRGYLTVDHSVIVTAADRRPSLRSCLLTACSAVYLRISIILLYFYFNCRDFFSLVDLRFHFKLHELPWRITDCLISPLYYFVIIINI